MTSWVPRGTWERIVETRKYCGHNAISTGVLAILCAVASVWYPEARYGVLAFGLLSAHCWTAYHLFSKIADLQAALDMKRIIRDAAGKQFVNLLPGDQLAVEGSRVITVDRAVSLEITSK